MVQIQTQIVQQYSSLHIFHAHSLMHLNDLIACKSYRYQYFLIVTLILVALRDLYKLVNFKYISTNVDDRQVIFYCLTVV